MTKNEIESLKVGSLVKYKNHSTEDMGLLTKIIETVSVERKIHRYYVFTWQRDGLPSSTPSTESLSSMNVSKFVLVQNAE